MKSRISTTVLCFVFVSVAKAQTWSKCSKSCGGGRKTMVSCLWGGQVCSTLHKGCNTQPCISGWGEWQPCSKSCGGGTTFKVDHCAFNNMDTCPKTYADCNTHHCKILQDCPRGYNFRYEDPSSCCKVVSEKCGDDSGSSRRIVGGKNATQGDWPWVAALVMTVKKIILCGGTLLNKRWLVTGAHCFDPPQVIHIVLGSVTIEKPALGHQIRTVEDYKTHPQYSYPRNDIALVKMNKDVVFTPQIKPICLPTGESTPLDTTCVVAGWGLTHWFDRKSFQNHLQQVKVRTLPLNACIQGYKNVRDNIWQKVDPIQHICAGKFTGGKDSCNGDSGGPLMCQRCSTCSWYLAGTLSFGAQICGQPGVPGCYMNVKNYQQWIRQHVSLSDKEYFVC